MRGNGEVCRGLGVDEGVFLPFVLIECGEEKGDLDVTMD